MKELECYKDLIRLRDTNREVKEAYLETKEYLQKEILKGPSDIGAIDLESTGSKYNLTMGVYLEQSKRIDKQIAAAENIINNLDRRIEKIENTLQELQGLDYKVVYLRDIELMTLLEIAEELGYSETHIKRISANCK